MRLPLHLTAPQWAGAAATSAAIFLLLGLIARALDQTPRLDALNQQAVVAEGARRHAGGPVAEMLCRGPLETAVSEVNKQLRADALAAGAEVVDLQLSPEAKAPSVDIESATLRMAIKGPDAAVTTFLKMSAERRHPIVFDQVGLAPTGDDLNAVFEGRLLCRRSAS